MVLRFAFEPPTLAQLEALSDRSAVSTAEQRREIAEPSP
jgi:hypothetical protein